MKKLLLTGLLAAGVLHGAQATNYYVSSGVGANAPAAGANTTATGQGLSPARPFLTIQYAADKTLPGDTVFVRAGTYINADADRYQNPAVLITRSGAPGRYIVVRNYPGDAQKPLLRFSTFQGFYLRGGVSYVEINGFRIQGNNGTFNLAPGVPDTRTTSPMYNQPGGCADGGANPSRGIYNGSGITTSGDATRGYPHHLRFANNEVFDCGAAGIGTGGSDYVTIENNLVYNNSWYTIYGTSGISMNSSHNFDHAPGYHMVIRNNRVFGNRLYVQWFAEGQPNPCRGITDGNGIILDTNDNIQTPAASYDGRFLVANNLVVNNGGAGIQLFKTSHADVINNTAYLNSQSIEIDNGEIYVNQGKDVLFQNNILVGLAGNKVFGSVSTANNVKYVNNLFYGGTITGTTTIPATNNLVADPQFRAPGVDWATADFTLRPGSPAIDAGVNNLLSATDLAGNPRVSGGTVDLGAYEYRRPLAAGAGAGPTAGLVAYPNPMAGRATLRYALPRAGAVRLEVLDALGRRVALLVDGEQPAGPHEVEFAPTAAAAGLYHVRLTTPDGRTQLALAQLR